MSDKKAAGKLGIEIHIIHIGKEKPENEQKHDCKKCDRHLECVIFNHIYNQFPNFLFESESVKFEYVAKIIDKIINQDEEKTEE